MEALQLLASLGMTIVTTSLPRYVTRASLCCTPSSCLSGKLISLNTLSFHLACHSNLHKAGLTALPQGHLYCQRNGGRGDCLSHKRGLR